MSRLFVCGDMHGREFDSMKINTKQWEEIKQLTKEDVLIQLGDFGWLWDQPYENKEQEYWLDKLAGMRCTFAVVPGNHDNYDLIESLPLIKKWGGSVRVLKREKERLPKTQKGLTKNKYSEGELYFFERGEVYNINGKTFWIMGGALSIDKDIRMPGISWWDRELPSYQEMNKGMENLDKVNWSVDYVLTHTCPVSIMAAMLKIKYKSEIKYSDPTSTYLQEVLKDIKFKEWHFGHFHQDIVKKYPNGEVFGCHYNNNPYELKE